MTVTDASRRRLLNNLREIAGSFEYQASISANGGSIKNADKLEDWGYTVRWALRQLDPTAGEREMLDSITAPLTRAAE